MPCQNAVPAACKHVLLECRAETRIAPSHIVAQPDIISTLTPGIRLRPNVVSRKFLVNVIVGFWVIVGRRAFEFVSAGLRAYP